MKTKFIAFLLLVLLTGCGAEAPKREASSQSDVLQTDKEAPTAPRTINNDSGGGGGRDEKITAQISFDQADKSKVETVSTERKIIRNADLV